MTRKFLPLIIVLTIFVLSRTFLFFTALKVKNPNVSRMFDNKNELEYYGTFGTLFHGWDSDWYLSIADNGYPKLMLEVEGYKQQSVYAFFPLYPLLIKIAGNLFGSNVTGAIIIANLALIIAGLIFYFVAKNVLDGTYGIYAVKYLFIFPTSFLFSVIQSESLFICLILGFFLALERNKLVYAGIIGYLLALTKSIGFLVFIPLLYEALKNKNKTHVICSLFPIFGILTFMIFTFYQTGDLFIVFNIQQAWNKFINLNPFIFLSSFNFTLYRNQIVLNTLYSVLIFIAAILGSGKLSFSYKFIVWSFTIIHLLTTVKYWHIYSYPRYVSVLFTAFLFFTLIAKKNRFIDTVLTFSFIILSIFFLELWINGYPFAM